MDFHCISEHVRQGVLSALANGDFRTSVSNNGFCCSSVVVILHIMGFNVDFLLCVSAGTLCSSTRIYYALFVLVLAVVVPVGVYFLVVQSYADYKSELWTCNIKEEYW